MTNRLLTTALFLAVLPGAVFAQGRNCGDRALIVERLESKYGEARTAAGLTTQNGMVEIFASDDSGSWTILITTPSGQSCLVAAGESWQDEAPVKATPSGSPA